MHSRRAFSNVSSQCEATIQCLSWTMESMKSLHIDIVLFATESNEVVKVLINSQDWPVLDTKIDQLAEMMVFQPDWSIDYEDLLANKGANAIAKSVIKDGRIQSHVSRGYPIWLEHVFMRE